MAWTNQTKSSATWTNFEDTRNIQVLANENGCPIVTELDEEIFARLLRAQWSTEAKSTTSWTNL